MSKKLEKRVRSFQRSYSIEYFNNDKHTLYVNFYNDKNLFK